MSVELQKHIPILDERQSHECVATDSQQVQQLSQPPAEPPAEPPALVSQGNIEFV